MIFNNRAVRVLETSTFGLVETEEKMTIAILLVLFFPLKDATESYSQKLKKNI